MKLKGIRVVDLSNFLPGPHLSMMMADHGADVIKVEAPGGDATRHLGPRQGDASIYFRNVNRGKRSVAVDLKQAEGREFLLRLAASADVFIETFRPGVVDRLGIGYEVVRARAPAIVYCSISAFGQDSTERENPAHDLAIQSYVGMAKLNEGQDGKPTMPAMPAADMAASLMALSGILMALIKARESGDGDYLDMAMYDSLVSWSAHATLSVFAEGKAPVRSQERLFGGAALYSLYETADGRWLALGASEIKFAENLMSALERPDLIEVCRQPAGPAQEPAAEFLRQTFIQQPLSHWIGWFKGREISFAPVLDLAEGFEQPLMRERQMLLHDDQGRAHIGVPMKFAREPAKANLALARLGQHNGELAGELGYDEAEIAQLAKSGVLVAEN